MFVYIYKCSASAVHGFWCALKINEILHGWCYQLAKQFEFVCGWLIFHVGFVLRRIIVGCDWCFDNLCGSHLNSGLRQPQTLTHLGWDLSLCYNVHVGCTCEIWVQTKSARVGSAGQIIDTLCCTCNWYMCNVYSHTNMHKYSWFVHIYYIH